MTDKTIIALIKPYDTRFSVFAHGDGGGRTVLEVDWATVLSGGKMIVEAWKVSISDTFLLRKIRPSRGRTY